MSNETNTNMAIPKGLFSFSIRNRRRHISRLVSFTGLTGIANSLSILQEQGLNEEIECTCKSYRDSHDTGYLILLQLFLFSICLIYFYWLYPHDPAFDWSAS